MILDSLLSKAGWRPRPSKLDRSAWQSWGRFPTVSFWNVERISCRRLLTHEGDKEVKTSDLLTCKAPEGRPRVRRLPATEKFRPAQPAAPGRSNSRMSS